MKEQTGAHRRPRRAALTVAVTISTEPLDFDAWAERYVRAVVSAARRGEQLGEAA